MSLSTNLTSLIIGAGIGLGIAVLGALVEYRLSLRSNAAAKTHHLPSCLLFVIGGLILASIASIVTSLILNVSIGPALILGAGMLGGFYIGFVLLFILWFYLE
jgi:hypothetical protein